MLELVVVLVAGLGLGVEVLILDPLALDPAPVAELVLPPAASSFAARALVWCKTERMCISRVELWL